MAELNYFEKSIEAYLFKEAAKDEMLAASLLKEGKSIKECCDFIISEVMKSNRKGFHDDEIYGLAKHYYDEDEIAVDGKTVQMRVVVNHEVEITEEEIKEAKTVAFNKVVEEEQRKLRPVKKRKAEPVDDGQLSLLDHKKSK